MEAFYRLGPPFFVHALSLVTLTAALASVAAPSCRALTYYSRPPFPTGNLRFSQPQVRWKVWTADNIPVQSVEMSLNGRSVAARYLREERSAVYVPEAPLAAGEYSVRCRVTLTSGEPLDRAWSFAVAKGAAARLRAPDREPQRSLDAANGYRRAMGLPDMRLDSALCASAASHSRYLDTNGEFGHYETAGHEEFVGRDLLERSAAFGYWGGGYEDVSFGTSNPATALDRLFDAPYHRLPFMQPGSPDFGMGRAGRQTTLEFGLTQEAGVSVYPAPGQVGVPRVWSDNEEPNPLTPHGTRGRTGYIITYAYFAPEAAPIVIESAVLTDVGGKRTPCLLNTPANDAHLTNALFLIPRSPLLPAETYTVDVHAKTADGQDLSRRWSFTTERQKR